MPKLLFICAILLHVILLPQALAQTSDTGPAFDYDTALELSQAAIGRELGEHRLIDAVSGDQVMLSELRGKPLVLSMVYTSCYQICPMTTRHLAGVIGKARDALGDDSFNVALIGFDSAVDTPAAMRYFADRQGVGDRDWRLFSTSAETVDALSADLGFQYFRTSNGFDHLIQASVVDADGKLYRQVYGQVFETPLLVDPLIELVLGRAPPEQSLLENLVARVKLFCTTYDPLRDGYYFDYSIFLGMLIGATIIGFTATIVYRGLKNH